MHVHLPILYPSCQSDFDWSIPELDYWSKAKNNCNHHATPFHQVIATSTSNAQQSKAWLHHLCKYRDKSCCSCMHASKYHFYINLFTHVYHKNPDQLLLYFIFIWNMLTVISFKHMHWSTSWIKLDGHVHLPTPQSDFIWSAAKTCSAVCKYRFFINHIMHYVY